MARRKPQAPATDEPFAKRLRRLRLACGLSQRALSGPGISHAYISRLEAGNRQPSVKAIRRLARTLGVSPVYLETGSDVAAHEAREIGLAEAALELRLDLHTERTEKKLRALLVEAQEAGDQAAEHGARAALGLVAHRRGDYREAIGQLEQVLAAGGVSPLSQPDLYGTLGHAYAAAGMPEKAVALFERCLQEVEQNQPACVRFATYLSYALSDLGELARAREVLREALERAEDVLDPYTRVRLHWSQARAAAAERDDQTALRELRRAIALLETTEDTRQLGRAHVLYAEILTFAGEPAEAGSHLELAEQLLGTHPDAEDLYWLRTEQARRAAELGAGEQAIERAREALSLIGGRDPAEEGTAYWALGQGLAERGDLDAANDALRRAVELLHGERRWREAHQACRSWASILRKAGRDRQAVEVLEQAAQLATRSETAGLAL